MTTRFAAVRTALAQLLTANAMALGAGVHEGRTDAFSKTELPAINVVPGAHQQLEGGLDFDCWSFDVELQICTHGSNAYAAADAIVVQLPALICNASSIKALAYNPRNDGGDKPAIVGADYAYQMQTITYRFECQTALNSLV